MVIYNIYDHVNRHLTQLTELSLTLVNYFIGLLNIKYSSCTRYTIYSKPFAIIVNRGKIKYTYIASTISYH